uniref:Uncharacterized protein n=1 Tax=Cajanus cajan TaxID=3821 RepID=A0A151RNF0_CAJCA|nr:hypothetical protein KK1_034463 [Cajanus cajan]KYP44045.1 hypothetical protein KK1_034468 [Cajanus cajan]
MVINLCLFDSTQSLDESENKSSNSSIESNDCPRGTKISMITKSYPRLTFVPIMLLNLESNMQIVLSVRHQVSVYGIEEHCDFLITPKHILQHPGLSQLRNIIRMVNKRPHHGHEGTYLVAVLEIWTHLVRY